MGNYPITKTPKGTNGYRNTSFVGLFRGLEHGSSFTLRLEHSNNQYLIFN